MMPSRTKMDAITAPSLEPKAAPISQQSRSASMRRCCRCSGRAAVLILPSKNLDSHLKPYVCKYGPTDENCRNLRFSSNACLFRHEREMHGLHNHGLNPYLCIFQGCERNRPDNGFPRRWNQRDHMKRVHGWEETDNENQNGSNYPEAPRRRKGPGASNSVPMKRTGTSRVQANCYHGSRTGGAPRYAQVQRGLQAQNIMIPGITDDSFYTPHTW